MRLVNTKSLLLTSHYTAILTLTIYSDIMSLDVFEFERKDTNIYSETPSKLYSFITHLNMNFAKVFGNVMIAVAIFALLVTLSDGLETGKFDVVSGMNVLLAGAYTITGIGLRNYSKGCSTPRTK